MHCPRQMACLLLPPQSSHALHRRRQLRHQLLDVAEAHQRVEEEHSSSNKVAEDYVEDEACL